MSNIKQIPLCQRKKKKGDSRKRGMVILDKNMNIIHEFNSVEETAEFTGISRKGLYEIKKTKRPCASCRGNSKKWFGCFFIASEDLEDFIKTNNLTKG